MNDVAPLRHEFANVLKNAVKNMIFIFLQLATHFSAASQFGYTKIGYQPGLNVIRHFRFVQVPTNKKTVSIRSMRDISLIF